MNLHQVLTGAVNPGDHCFSVGSVGDQRFTVSERDSRVALDWFAPGSQPGWPGMKDRGRERLVAPSGSASLRAQADLAFENEGGKNILPCRA